MSKLMHRFVSTTILMRLPSFFIHLLSYGINLSKDISLGDFVSTKFLHKAVELLSAMLG